MEPLETTKDFISQLSPLQIGAVVLAFLFLLIGLRLILKKPPAHLTAFSGNAGNVLVSRKALQELVKQACLLDDWVEAARPAIRVRDNKVTAHVELRLHSPDNLKAVCERVQEHITALLQKSLSFEQIGEIQIVVKSFGTEGEERPEPPPQTASTSTEASLLDSKRDIGPKTEPPKEPEKQEDDSERDDSK